MLVNKSMHWSLCVVVNPGAVVKHREIFNEDSLTNVSENDSFPCLLFFDALKAHAKNKVASRVRNWLNTEWTRLKPDILPKKPFDAKSMTIYSPKGTY